MKPETTSESLAAPRYGAWTALAAALIVVAGIAAYANGFHGPFIFDDLVAIQDNPALRHFPAWENLVPPQVNPLSRRPVVNFTLAINYAIGGLDVRGYHAGNLLIHLLAALTLFGIVRRTIARGSIVHRPSSIVAVAFAIALIWAVHPLQTESVTYVTQRTECLAGLFLLLTLYGAIRGATGAHPWRWHAASIAACALGMGTKEVMATAPILVLLYDRCFLSGSFREALRRRRPFYLGLAATWAILGALLLAYPWGGKTGSGFGLTAVGPWQYARTQPGVILNYLWLSFWPNSLCLDYGWPIAKSAWQIVPQAAVLAALLAGTLWALRRAPELEFLGAWFFLILAPTSSFMPIADAAVERRMYLPLAAIVTACVIAAWRLGNPCLRRVAESDATRKLLGRVLATVALLSVAVALGYRTFERNADYRDAISIWQDTARERPDNARAWNNLGCAYSWTGHADAALPYFDKAIGLDHAYADAFNNRGVAFTRLNRMADALRDLDKAVELNPEYASAYNNRAVARLNAGQYNKALADCDQAIKLLPGYAQAYCNRGNCLLQTGHVAEALREYDKAIELLPENAEAHDNRANAMLLDNQPAEAIPDCDQAIALRPDFAEAYNTRASAYLRTGRFELAIRDCDRAIALQPNYADAYLNRASAHDQRAEYDLALCDLKIYYSLGGRPQPQFLQKLLRAAGRTK